MKSIANTESAIKIFNKRKSKNLQFLLKQRFNWMNKFINDDDVGIEVGSGAGFAKFYIKNKNLKLTDLSFDSHLDFGGIDAQSTNFENNSFDYVIASNMIHHVPYPIKFFREMNRILKKNGKLIIFDAHCSVLFQIITILMKHEGFDFTLDVWDGKVAKSDEKDPWDGNIAVSNLIFDDKINFNNKLGKLFTIEYEKLTECFIFLNSGGVTSKTFYIPLPNFLLNFVNSLDNLLVKSFPNIFGLGKRIVLKKIN
jgi:SAM-dependent methyltransferase